MIYKRKKFCGGDLASDKRSLAGVCTLFKIIIINMDVNIVKSDSKIRTTANATKRVKTANVPTASVPYSFSSRGGD